MNDPTEHPDDTGEWAHGEHIVDPVTPNLTHPRWCKPDRCEAPFGGKHSDAPRVLRFTSKSSAFGQTRLWQSPDLPTSTGRTMAHPPMVELVVGDMDTGKRCRADLTLSQTRQLQRDLISTLMAAGDDDTV